MSRRLLLSVATLLFWGVSCQEDDIPTAIIAEHQSLLLISLDGFAFDYMDAVVTPTLDSLKITGVAAEALVPVFPTKTFPNHYTQVTGLYPEHHGIIANRMYDSVFKEYFSLSNASVREGKWYGGEPIWVTAVNQGLSTATMFWPGSDAEIAGVRPDRYFPFNGATPEQARVQQVVDWLATGEDRPHFISLYFELVDQAGHAQGPHSQAVQDAVATIDQLLKELLEAITSLGLQQKINVILVSDHGMTQIRRDQVIFLDDYIDLNDVEVINWSPVLEVIPAIGKTDQVYLALRDAHPQLGVYLKSEVPANLHFNEHPRITPIVALAEAGWSISSRSFFSSAPEAFTGGTHGYSPEVAAMGGIFLASGPKFQSGVTMPPISSVHLYELMCEILGLQPALNDGKMEVWEEALR